mmetsp:Transcript_24456/g.64317  ORF Transcript_24456/g.64317 Transcript_24456/m.64317 type:complete len:81 (-) Transcript_24456:551-793(-)
MLPPSVSGTAPQSTDNGPSDGKRCRVLGQLHSVRKMSLDKFQETLARTDSPIVFQHPLARLVSAWNIRIAENSLQALPKI